MEVFRQEGLCPSSGKKMALSLRKGQLLELVKKQAMEISGIQAIERKRDSQVIQGYLTPKWNQIQQNSGEI